MTRLTDEPGFVLHSLPYKETSLIVELFLRDRGRLSAVAKGARRPTSMLRPVLLQFQPIDIRVSGRNELRTLTRAEWVGGMAVPAGRARPGLSAGVMPVRIQRCASQTS